MTSNSGTDGGGGRGIGGGGSVVGTDSCGDYGGSVKRRCSSSADDDNADHSSSRSRLAPVAGTRSHPVPVITEYAPALPHFSTPTCILPYLSHSDAVQTVLASSNTNALHSGFSNLLSLDGLRHIPSFNCELVEVMIESEPTEHDDPPPLFFSFFFFID